MTYPHRSPFPPDYRVPQGSPMPRTPTQADIDLDESGFYDDDAHEDIAHEAGYLDVEAYKRATGMPDWWLDLSDCGDEEEDDDDA